MGGKEVSKSLSGVVSKVKCRWLSSAIPGLDHT